MYKNYNILVSIVVPIYKSERYLHECIDSILRQTYQYIEIILVDDGSPDNCPQICDFYQAKDYRVKVIHQENKGPVEARRIGINSAKGLYITTLDSDDTIDNNYIEEIVNTIIKHDVDIVSYGFKKLVVNEHNEEKIIVQFDNIAEGKYDAQSIIDDIVQVMIMENNQFGIMPSICCKIFKTELLRKYINLIPSDLKNGDDAACCYECILNADAIYISRTFCGYNYRTSAESLTQGADVKYLEHMECLFKYLYERFSIYKSDALKRQLFIYEVYMLFDVGISNVYKLSFKSKRSLLLWIRELFAFNKYIIESDFLMNSIKDIIYSNAIKDHNRAKILIELSKKRKFRAILYEIRK